MRVLRHILSTSAAALMTASVATAETPSSNVVFYTGNPGLDPDAYPLVGRQVDGYVTGIVAPFNGASLTVSRQDPDAATGFAPLTNFVLNQQAPATAFVSINQIAPDKSAAFFGEPGTYDPSGAHATPNPGTYLTPQRVRFQVPDAVTTVEYSINGGPFLPWDGVSSIPVVSDATIAYQGTRLGQPGPMKTVVYTINSLPCSDIDGDGIPDRIEEEVGTDPFLAEGDANGNLVDDIVELLRGAPTIVPASPAPNLLDSDGDTWSDFDEGLRGTDPNDALDFPAAPSLDTVEIELFGAVSPIDPLLPPPPFPDPPAPYPDNFEVAVLTPGGVVVSPVSETADVFAQRTSGEQFHLLRAKALDGSGRALLAVVPPEGLCVDETTFCNNGDDLGLWVASYNIQYASRILEMRSNLAINPRTTAVAFLLNQYYENQLGGQFIPGVEGRGVDPGDVFALRSQRNESELYDYLSASVSDAMVHVVSDYFKYATTPSAPSTFEQIAAIFAGETIDPADIPAGVREQNFALAAADVAAVMSNLPAAETELTGQIFSAPSGFTMHVGGTIYRLRGLADSFVDNSTVTLTAIVDADDCNFASPYARVTGIVSRTPAALPPANDSDNDGLDDDWEFLNFGDLDENGEGDADNDGLSNLEEHDNGTDPNSPDALLVAGFQGDADLSLVVNAADLVSVQTRLGADYTCATCRGRGDANGNRHVTDADYDAVALSLFATYGDDPGCVLEETDCNDQNKSLLFPDENFTANNAAISLDGMPATLGVGDIAFVDVVLDTGGTPIRAAGTRITFNPAAVEIINGSANANVFDAYTIFNVGAGTVDIAALSSSDVTGLVTLASFQVRGLATGSADIAFSDDPQITNLVEDAGASAGIPPIQPPPVAVEPSAGLRTIWSVR